MRILCIPTKPPAHRWTFIIAAICGVTGILVTYFFVPDMTGVDLADKDAEFMKYLADNGWHGEVGEEDDKELIMESDSIKEFEIQDEEKQ